jgi:uncharacterized membrane protein
VIRIHDVLGRRRRLVEVRAGAPAAEGVPPATESSELPFAELAAAWIIAVILNYVKRSEVRGRLESHFRWQIRTFWFGLLWVSLCVFFTVVTLGIGLLVAWLPFLLVGFWIVYRVVRGWRALTDRRPMYS